MDMFVLDPGAHAFRAGRAEDFPADAQTPYVVLPSVVRTSDDADSSMTEPYQIFDDAGRVANWDGYEAMLSYIFYKQLGWPQGDEGYTIFTEDPTRTSRAGRECLVQMLFETFNVRGTFFLDSAVASVYAAGKLSGISVDIGHSGTTVAQVIDGATLIGSAERLPYGAAALQALAREQLQKKGAAVKAAGLAAVCEQHAVVAESREDFEAAGDAEAKEYQLPDGQSVSIRAEWHTLGEALIHPEHYIPHSVAAHDTVRLLGIPEAAFCCAMANPDGAARLNALSNTVLCGGGSRVPGLQQRCLRELRGVLPSTLQISMLKIPEYLPERTQQHAGYVGAAIVGKSMNAINTMTKEDYEERGPAYIHKKC